MASESIDSLISAVKPHPNLDVSVVIPFYQKLEAFKLTLPRNAAYFQRNGIEVILVLDEPTEQDRLLDTILQYPLICWKILVNEETHEWRNPAKAINVGIRNATKKYILVMSPESEFVTDIIWTLRSNLDYYPNRYAIGRVMFATFEEDIELQNLPKARTMWFGSILVRRSQLEAIHGYSEHYQLYGGEDVNLRARLDSLGVRRLRFDQAILVHRESPEGLKARRERGNHLSRFSRSEMRRTFWPSNAINNDENWGREFSKFIYDWQNNSFATSIAEGYLARFERYEICRGDAFKRRHSIVALVQAYNEGGRITEFLSHVAAHCDGIVLLVDGAHDETYRKAVSEKLLVKCQKARNGFDDLQNRNMLLDIASFFRIDWLYFIDVDEAFDGRFQTVYDAIEKNVGAEVICFKRVQLWNDEEHYRVDYPFTERGIQHCWRMFRSLGRTQIASSHKLHFRLIPISGKVVHSEVLILHYGMLTHEQRIRKAEFYSQEDRDGSQRVGYGHLLDEVVVLGKVSELTPPSLK